MADDDKTQSAGFVGHLVKDAKSPPETRTLTGWLGDAAEEGDQRLYTNADLSCYIDIPADAILHIEPIRDSQPPDGVFVWVRRDAALKYGGSAASRAAQFLQGEVQQDFASGGFANVRAAVPGLTVPINTQFPCDVLVTAACTSLKECQTKPPTAIPPCTQTGPHCPTTPATTCTQIGPHCPTSCGADCQSLQVNCTQMGEICLTHPVECTQFGPKCPSVGVPCPTPECTIPPACHPTHVGPACPTPTPPVCYQPQQAFRAADPIGPIGPTGFFGCTQFQPQCPQGTGWSYGPHCTHYFNCFVLITRQQMCGMHMG